MHTEYFSITIRAPTAATDRVVPREIAAPALACPRAPGDTSDLMPIGTDATTASDILAAGGVVAIPTETVYGLAASIAHPEAVARVFAIKGRPLGHPLIVHLARRADLPRYASVIPAGAQRLADAFWPGPLTMILPRTDAVPELVTGGAATVGLRMPDHPLTLDVIARTGAPIAAPSANRFGSVSPTTAAHVAADLGDDVDYILDGGPCNIGVESTIVEFADAGNARLLRPGGLAESDLQAVLGAPLGAAAADSAPAPGTLASHYATRAQVIACQPRDLHAVLTRTHGPVAVLTPHSSAGAVAAFAPAHTCVVADDNLAFARELYARLRELDATGVNTIVAVLPSPSGLGAAIIDRLLRAASPRPREMT